MTCVVGVAAGRHCLLGADSCVVDADGVTWQAATTPKVWEHPDGWCAGFAGHVALGVHVRHRLVLPPPPLLDKELDRWAEIEIPAAAVQALSGVLEPFSAALDDDEHAELVLLLGVRGRLYTYTHPGLVTRAPGHAAIGTGAHVALGSLDETRSKGARERILRALQRAERRVIGVRRPWRWAETG